MMMRVGTLLLETSEVIGLDDPYPEDDLRPVTFFLRGGHKVSTRVTTAAGYDSVQYLELLTELTRRKDEDDAADRS